MLLTVRFTRRLGRVHGSVRRVGCDVSEERLLSFLLLLDEPLGVIKEDVGTVARESFASSVVQIRIVKVVVVPEIGHAVDMRRRKPNATIKAPILGAERIVRADMPFAEMHRFVAVVFEMFGNGDFAFQQMQKNKPTSTPH